MKKTKLFTIFSGKRIVTRVFITTQAGTPALPCQDVYYDYDRDDLLTNAGDKEYNRYESVLGNTGFRLFRRGSAFQTLLELAQIKDQLRFADRRFDAFNDFFKRYAAFCK